MNIVFLSNYFNHHQKPLSDNLYLKCNKYYFIANAKISEERKKLGYSQEEPQYCIDNSNSINDKNIFSLIDDSDVIVYGSAPEYFMKRWKDKDKLVFKYGERPLRHGIEPLKYLGRLVKWNIQIFRLGRPVYLLCASAYAPYDYSRFFMFKNRTYKWGYFTETKRYDINAILARKDKLRILWVARFIKCKHPEHIILLAKKLHLKNYKFTIDMIGIGPLQQEMIQKVFKYGIQEHFNFLGAMSNVDVRRHMERAGIFIFSSDNEEGWGAVLNESMNSGCAVVSSHAAGATPYLINNSKNGYIYTYGNIDEMYDRVSYLLENFDEQNRLGKAAYETICNEWNAEVASDRLLELSKRIIGGEKSPDIYASGPCSKAPIIKDSWRKI